MACQMRNCNTLPPLPHRLKWTWVLMQGCNAVVIATPVPPARHSRHTPHFAPATAVPPDQAQHRLSPCRGRREGLLLHHNGWGLPLHSQRPRIHATVCHQRSAYGLRAVGVVHSRGDPLGNSGCHRSCKRHFLQASAIASHPVLPYTLPPSLQVPRRCLRSAPAAWTPRWTPRARPGRSWRGRWRCRAAWRWRRWPFGQCGEGEGDERRDGMIWQEGRTHL